MMMLVQTLQNHLSNDCIVLFMEKFFPKITKNHISEKNREMIVQDINEQAEMIEDQEQDEDGQEEDGQEDGQEEDGQEEEEDTE